MRSTLTTCCFLLWAKWIQSFSFPVLRSTVVTVVACLVHVPTSLPIPEINTSPTVHSLTLEKYPGGFLHGVNKDSLSLHSLLLVSLHTAPQTTDWPLVNRYPSHIIGVIYLSDEGDTRIQEGSWNLAPASFSWYRCYLLTMRFRSLNWSFPNMWGLRIWCWHNC